jgi:hypothetical protein
MRQDIGLRRVKELFFPQRCYWKRAGFVFHKAVCMIKRLSSST